MRKYIVILLSICIISLPGCLNNKKQKKNKTNNSQHDIVHAVSWYKEHQKERLEMLSICEENPGEFDKYPNCINAETAEKQLRTSNRNVLGGEPMKNIKFGNSSKKEE